MNDAERGQVNQSAAQVYEEFFVPALFQEWAEPVAEAAGIQHGQCVLDVGCGTGVVARAVAPRVNPSGSVVGLDVNDGMLAVAQQIAPHVDWRSGVAESLPFENNTFDAVVSQFALMFFDDKETALAEMMRVLRPNGRMVVVVWDKLENTPGYAAMVALLHDLFGPEAADALRAPYSLGQRSTLRALFRRAGIDDIHIVTRQGTARFPTLASWVHTDVKGWTLAELIDDTQLDRLLEEAQEALRPFAMADGRVQFPAPAHIVTARKTLES